MRQNEKKTSGKLAYREVFFEVLTFGESRTSRKAELFEMLPGRSWSKCLFLFADIRRKPNTEKKRS